MINWIKLDISILDDAKIKIIRSHPNGDSVVLLWIGLLCLAMKSARPGTIEISDGLPYTVDDLSNMYNIEKKTVEMGLALFCKYRMIEVFEGGSIEVINFSKHQKIEEIERRRDLTRVRVERYRQKTRASNALLTHHPVTVTPTDVDKDVDEDVDKKPPIAPRKNRGTVYSDSFISFWTAYPSKVGKDAAWAAWSKRNGRLPNITLILSAIETQKKSRRWQEEEGRYIPNPATWINQGRWADELEIQEGSIDEWTRKKQAELEGAKSGAV
jgi:predicted phage replisome organizer